MTVLPTDRGRIHGADHLGTQQAHEPHQTSERLLMSPLGKRRLDAFGVGPIGLIEEVEIAHAENAETLPQLRFANDAERRAAFLAGAIAAALAARAGDESDDLAFIGVTSHGRGHHALIIRMRGHRQQVGLQHLQVGRAGTRQCGMRCSKK